MIDFTTLFKDATVAGVPLILLVIALVQWIKDVASLEGKQVRITAMLVGFVLGLGYQYTQAAPVGFNAWFLVVVFGVLLGLGASGLYDAGSNIVGAALKAKTPAPPAK